jgi:hypothetical protein
MVLELLAHGSYLTDVLGKRGAKTDGDYLPLREHDMSVTDYVIDILLILIIFRQVAPRELTLRAAVLPMVLLVMAGAVYLRPDTLGGNDLALIVILAIAGIVLGLASGFVDRVWRDQGGRLLYRVGVVSIVAWVLGMGFRLGFAYHAYHSGAAVARFSVSHSITGARIWTTALVIMAFGQVLARLGALQLRRLRANRGPIPADRRGMTAAV